MDAGRPTQFVSWLDGIAAVTFDVGGTLIQPWPSVGQIYADIAAAHGYPNLSPQILRQRFVEAWRNFKDFNHTSEHWSALVDATFEGITELPPSQTFFGALYEHFAKPDAWRIFDDAFPALEALAERGMKLALISNWDTRLRDLLARLDLLKFFDPVLISCEIGTRKPSAAIFHSASEALRVAPSAILHVGDSPGNDVAGARGAGFKAVLLQRQAKTPGVDHISLLTQLCAASLGSESAA